MKTLQVMPVDMRKRLVGVIENSGLTITEISRRTGLSRSLIYAYMYDGKNPTVISLWKLCTVLHVSADWILFGRQK